MKNWFDWRSRFNKDSSYVISSLVLRIKTIKSISNNDEMMVMMMMTMTTMMMMMTMTTMMVIVVVVLSLSW